VFVLFRFLRLLSLAILIPWKQNFGDIPAEAAKRYGDAKFVAMMMAKVICVQLVSMLGFDFLFQDVDIVWYKNPLDYFHDTTLPAYNYDVFFQDDGGHSIRYAPYSANSGFYFVRYNKRTRHFFTSLLMAGDLVLKTDSHQQALIATLNEHVSLYGLKVKVLSRDMEEFPGGYQFHQKSKKYMKEFFAGNVSPIIFHMSWTLNKNNKLLFFRQMGEWYVEDKCIQQQVNDIAGANVDDVVKLAPVCCSAEPLISCHYRDKPSIKPCRDSPPIDNGRPSWW
jgi:Nucleotide-diphospho-sugar transferase